MSESLRDSLLHLDLEHWEDALVRGSVLTCNDLSMVTSADELPKVLPEPVRVELAALAVALSTGHDWRELGAQQRFNAGRSLYALEMSNKAK
eukprot:gene19369-16593_t